MQEFVYHAYPGRVVFGFGAARTALDSEIGRLGVSRVLLIAGPPVEKLARELAAPLGDRVAGVFTDVQP
ncbi:MAG: maleylacetate reductase, partial [Actinomycetota bacterium]